MTQDSKNTDPRRVTGRHSIDAQAVSTASVPSGIAAVGSMTDEQLRRLSRVELLEIMVAQGRELEKAREDLAAANQQLRSQQIALEQIAAVAHAALGRGSDNARIQQAVDAYTKQVEDTEAQADETGGGRGWPSDDEQE